MKEIPTAKEFLEEKCYITNDGVEDIHDSLLNVKDAMIEFAKLHVEAALKAAEKSNFINAEGISISPKSNNLHWTAYGNVGKITYNKDSILNAYPLDNIK